MSKNDTPIVSAEEMLFHLDRISPSKSRSPDNLTKLGEIIAKPVTVILNVSFMEERFPMLFEQANVCPIPISNMLLEVNICSLYH